MNDKNFKTNFAKKYIILCQLYVPQMQMLIIDLIKHMLALVYIVCLCFKFTYHLSDKNDFDIRTTLTPLIFLYVFVPWLHHFMCAIFSPIVHTTYSYITMNNTCTFFTYWEHSGRHFQDDDIMRCIFVSEKFAIFKMSTKQKKARTNRISITWLNQPIHRKYAKL